jgi:hypothetical protein
MPLSEEERRRRQAIDRDPANKCRWGGGCGNTARLDQGYCGAHLEQMAREAQTRGEFEGLQKMIFDLPMEFEPVRCVLSKIVDKLAG